MTELLDFHKRMTTNDANTYYTNTNEPNILILILIIPGVHVTLSLWISEENCNPDELQQEVRRELDRVGLGRQLGGLARGNG